MEITATEAAIKTLSRSFRNVAGIDWGEPRGIAARRSPAARGRSVAAGQAPALLLPGSFPRSFPKLGELPGQRRGKTTGEVANPRSRYGRIIC